VKKNSNLGGVELIMPTTVLTTVDFADTPLAEFGDLINRYAEENLLDPYIVAAVIMVESSGKPEAYNSMSKATGLGGIMPREAGAVFEDRPTIEELKDPEINIAWLCKILGYYRNKYHDIEAALYQYSGGSVWPDRKQFKEKYFNRIMGYYAKYRTAHVDREPVAEVSTNP